MGMAASQARLLTLTARLHDVEYAAQSIQHAKLKLATQEDEAYEEYLKALDATSLTFTAMDSSGAQSLMIANYNNLFSINAANASGHNYVLIDPRGRVIVSQDINDGYHDFMNSNYTKNAYNFALYMLYGEEGVNYETGSTPETQALMNAMLNKINANLPHGDDDGDSQLANLIQSIFPNYTSGDILLSQLQNMINIPNPHTSTMTQENCNAFLNYFFGQYGSQLFNEMNEANHNMATDTDVAEFNYYVRIFNAIQEHGGNCISIEDFDDSNGPANAASNSSEWLTNMIQSGMFTIETFTNNNQTLVGASVASDPVLSFTTTTQIDSVAMAKAEAKYEHELKTIDKKDKKFDMDLNKLETERSALTKQVESIKKVVDDNIERTFGIFS